MSLRSLYPRNMARLASATLVVATLLVGLLAGGAEAQRIPTRECPTRHSTNCVWDGEHSGHKQGRSFYRTKSGHKVYIPHARAHRIVSRYRHAHMPAPVVTTPAAPTVAPKPVDYRSTYSAVGDSITYGFGTTDPTTKAWPALAGINGHGVPGRCLFADPCSYGRLLADFPTEATNLHTPVMIALIGTNDLRQSGWTFDQYVAAYQQLKAEADERGIRLVLSTITPFGTADRPNNDLRVKINEWIRSQGDYLDMESILIGSNGLMKPWFEDDGLHPNDLGNAAMANYVKAWMKADAAK